MAHTKKSTTKMKFVTSVLIVCVAFVTFWRSPDVKGQALPTTYEYFTEGGIQSGLTANTLGFFKLNGKDLRIVSGAMHYFRIHPDYWRDRLQKVRAMGANTVETYIPWNLHEPEQGVFDFGQGGRDLSMFLDVRRFVQLAQEEDLLVILRPGPYICAEYEFGGFPTWLLREPGMELRNTYQPYLDHARRYFDNFLPQVVDLQFTRGGSIIAMQLDNEYGSYKASEQEYLNFIKTCYDENGFGDTLYFTCDNRWGLVDGGPLVGTLATINFKEEPEVHLDLLLSIQPNRSVMVMEYWAGWFDNWFLPHETTEPDQFASVLETIFLYAGSVNFYMLHGGTNFAFLSGGRVTTTSYDYDSPLSEAGDYQEKYYRAMQLIEIYQVPRLHRPDMPAETPKTAYPDVALEGYLLYQDILARVPATARFTSSQPMSMEFLDMNNGNGQSYGYILYRKLFNGLGAGTKLKIGPVNDFGILLVDGQIQDSPTTNSYWITEQVEFELSLDSSQSYLIDVLVENMGRHNWLQEPHEWEQDKGLRNGSVLVDGVLANEFQIIALEFNSQWVRELSNWRVYESGSGDLVRAPAMFKATFNISGNPTGDTWLDMREWHKGIVFINGFNLGRYFRVGPQQTLYVPAPLLRSGSNTIVIFEQLQPGTRIQFRDQPILDQNL